MGMILLETLPVPSDEATTGHSMELLSMCWSKLKCAVRVQGTLDFKHVLQKYIIYYKIHHWYFNVSYT